MSCAKLSFFYFFPSIFLLACSNLTTSPPDTLTTVISSPIQSLNPLYTTDANSQHVNELTHVSLLKISERLIPEPHLAESFRIISDKTIEFQLRKGCRFENGREITADDVEQSLKLFADPNNKSAFLETFKKINRFEKLSPYLFRLHTDKPEPALIPDLTLLKILPTEAIKNGENPNFFPGGGPYRIANFTPSQINLIRNQPSCLPLARTEKITIKVVRDDLSRFLKLKNGEIDLVLNEMNYRKVELIQNSPTLGIKVKIDEGIGHSYLGVNMTNEKLRDPRVREALALSLDIPSIIKYKSRGMALPARNLLADQNYYSNLSVPIRSRDLTKARQLLDEAGYFNGSNSKPPLKIILSTNTNLISIENAKVIAAQAKEAGIEIQLRSYEWGIFYADVKSGNTELYMLRWVGVTDPGIYFEVFHSGEIGRNNRTRYKNPEMDKWTIAGQSTLDPKKRKIAFDQVQEIAHQDLPFIGLWNTKNVAVYRDRLANVRLHPTGSWLPLTEIDKK